MLRKIVNGGLLLAVVGAGYWFLSSEPKEPSAELLNTPLPSTLKGPEHSRVAKAKATLKTATRPDEKHKSALAPDAKSKSAAAPDDKAKSAEKTKPGAKLAAADKEAKKDSSNKAFAGLKASSLVKAKPKSTSGASSSKSEVKVKRRLVANSDAKASAKNKGAVSRESPAKRKLIASGDSATKPATKNKAVAGVQSNKKAAASSASASAPIKMDAVSSTPIEGFSLRRVALAREVEKREPSGVAGSFVKGTRVHLFMDAKNLSDSALELVVRWHDPALANPVSVSLKVPAHTGRYRTWANSSPVAHPGAHEVSVQVKDGPEIYRKSFEVLAAKKAPTASERVTR